MNYLFVYVSIVVINKEMAKSSAAENSAAEVSRQFRGEKLSNFCLHYHYFHPSIIADPRIM